MPRAPHCAASVTFAGAVQIVTGNPLVSSSSAENPAASGAPVIPSIDAVSGIETAIQEDADAVGISILSGAHMTLVPRILDGLKANGIDDVLVVVGGTIPTDDAEELRGKGVAAVFTPGAPTSEIVDFLKAKIPV